jgi:hypothetical protein
MDTKWSHLSDTELMRHRDDYANTTAGELVKELFDRLEEKIDTPVVPGKYAYDEAMD